jgi:ATP-dependent DNA helicase PIF1
VIDEVSMLDGALMDALDEVARAVRGRDSVCFGGIQLVLCGDFFQLPPVRRGEDDADADDATAHHCYAFGANAWAEAKLAVVQLTQPYRQSDDPAFFRLLNTIRRGQLDAAAEATLKRCEASLPVAQPEGGGPAIVPTRLHTHRADVERENVLALAELTGEGQSYAAEDSGGGGAGDATTRLAAAGCRARATLRLKVGAQVMLLRAVAPRAGLVNGARGVVVSFTQDAAVRSSAAICLCSLHADAHALPRINSGCRWCASRAA